MVQLIRIADLRAENIPSDSAVVFGGTFDPFHLGHLDVTRELLKFFKSVIIAPTSQNPWKTEQPTPLELRRQMIELILKAEKVSSGVELSSSSYVFAEELVQEFRTQRPGAALYWAVGEDSADSVSRWRNWDNLNVPTIVCPIRINLHATAIRSGDRPIHPAIAALVKEKRLYESA